MLPNLEVFGRDEVSFLHAIVEVNHAVLNMLVFKAQMNLLWPYYEEGSLSIT